MCIENTLLGMKFCLKTCNQRDWKQNNKSSLKLIEFETNTCIFLIGIYWIMGVGSAIKNRGQSGSFALPLLSSFNFFLQPNIYILTRPVYLLLFQIKKWGLINISYIIWTEKIYMRWNGLIYEIPYKHLYSYTKHYTSVCNLSIEVLSTICKI